MHGTDRLLAAPLVVRGLRPYDGSVLRIFVNGTLVNSPAWKTDVPFGP